MNEAAKLDEWDRPARHGKETIAGLNELILSVPALRS